MMEARENKIIKPLLVMSWRDECSTKFLTVLHSFAFRDIKYDAVTLNIAIMARKMTSSQDSVQVYSRQ